MRNSQIFCEIFWEEYTNPFHPYRDKAWTNEKPRNTINENDNENDNENERPTPQPLPKGGGTMKKADLMK